MKPLAPRLNVSIGTILTTPNDFDALRNQARVQESRLVAHARTSKTTFFIVHLKGKEKQALDRNVLKNNSFKNSVFPTVPTFS